ncbi:oxygen-independent coproporphyrinogen III oxidase [Variovorax sp. NFACC27]|uniref:oxygen-independent coproporphyrinogen III oxidase n=1 Tax=unclassified Variovorax TaxID=663243 RepID=UPI0008961B7B|nr:oxygen-independent coproporphyrinogen III oxidase [Variovorax sp. YR750]SEF20944.1 oxygen-independent coproporphyrinogen-3 oxidase [Variovorax sp. NFACC28]SEF51070.1 oxygen-independent coproporphyrinogen-3 oxidase [Variovorax sp. NFACC29]SFB68289.1 oxygen-independent coproporphyrinogen-3 oxidase [Variovorax sp. NFACC26]SFG49892.1 oxygen-independent coproporphyrinogen-3 oxidase [Variovorax sp. NFACC27]SEK85370.1 oxygen-independent coproporphyrinogen-3 oxidase [Variovorax sp. YR750]
MTSAAFAPVPAATADAGPVALPVDLLRQFDVPGPRYTSYPTADRFVEAFGADEYAQALRRRREAGTLAPPLSLYVHIPFCESLCYYCACNKIVTRHHERGRQYLADLAREAELQAAQLGRGATVGHLHLGGGSPTFLDDSELGELMALLHRSFAFVPGGERSIEIDPRTVDASRLSNLAALGFNRLSFGVQDFDPAVQQAVHRIQPAHQVFALMAAARELGFESINVDLIYGLPRQDDASFARTLAQIRELRPDRIALYAYAHLPERFKPQRRISVAELPDAAARVRMLASAIARLTEAGYVYIGMDHFALPDDPLAVARKEGRLHRDFQGYGTRPDGDLIALGVSGIGRVGATYSQNAKSLDEYRDLLDQGRLPVVRGLALSRDDLLRREVIMALMCRGRIDFDTMGESFAIDFRRYFAVEFAALGPLVANGLVRLSDHDLVVTPQGWFLVRAVAMVFDRYCRANRSRFSRVV